ncbi:MAG: peptidase M19, partial [Pseudomonas sp.]|nr:peptidase M19 [Pseudomonas sp.]
MSRIDAFGKPPVVFASGRLWAQAYAGPKAPAEDSARPKSTKGDSLMSPAELHADSIVIDGLIIAKWNRELFEDMRKGGL